MEDAYLNKDDVPNDSNLVLNDIDLESNHINNDFQ